MILTKQFQGILHDLLLYETDETRQNSTFPLLNYEVSISIPIPYLLLQFIVSNIVLSLPFLTLKVDGPQINSANLAIGRFAICGPTKFLRI
jgi:hypothetical protein